MKIIVFIIFQISVLSAWALSTNSLKVFGSYLAQAQKVHIQSEKKLMTLGEAHLSDHADASEKLSLAEMLPKTQKELVSFCKGHLKSIAYYYNLVSVKDIKTIKSPIFKDYFKMISSECKKK